MLKTDSQHQSCSVSDFSEGIGKVAENRRFLVNSLVIRFTQYKAVYVPSVAAVRSSGIFAICFLAGMSAASAQQSPAIVQPGAPGQTSKILSAATVSLPQHTPADADVSFMQGMIMHHAQAVEMTDLLRTHSRNKVLLAFGDRISISQSDEIRAMKQWLADHGKPISMGSGQMNHNMADMKGMPMDHMMNMALMPGMLTPEQMKALAVAKGKAFDHLFLTGMIQHHTGALTMVEELFDTPGAGQEAVLFDFANDVDNTQRAEIAIMQRMLSQEKQ